ncbi:hypothetical protein FQN54_006459 [Arachnomyces sp. PD_36]|nr:hypothetical protein FQN54_006459 [Arachnomyces sp. PD_36]
MARQGEKIYLDRLPSLVVENILQHLDLKAIKNLRLSCRYLGELCIGPRFKSFYHSRTKTDLSEESLKSLCALASHARLGPSVKKLTIVAKVYDLTKVKENLSARLYRDLVRTDPAPPLRRKIGINPTMELLGMQSELEWLQTQRVGLPHGLVIDSLVSAMRAFKTLESIILRVEIVQERNVVIKDLRVGDFPGNWRRASQVYWLTMTAVARSGILVDKLNVYSQIVRPRIPTSCITAQIMNLDAADRLDFPGKLIKSLEIGISPEAIGGFNTKILAGQNGHGIAKLLELLPNLETLNIRQCPDMMIYKRLQEDRILEEVTQVVHLPSLKRCSWSHMFFAKETMLQFLNKYSQLEHLALRNVGFTSASQNWTPIFVHLSNNMPALTFLSLSTLQPRDVNLDPEWSDPFREMPSHWYDEYTGGGRMILTQEFGAEEIKQGLKFRPPPHGRPVWEDDFF